MLNKIRKHPGPFIILLFWTLTFLLIIRASIINIPILYEDLYSYGLSNNQINYCIFVFSYMFVTVTVIAVILGIKFMEILYNVKLGIDRFLNISHKNIIMYAIVILPAPLYMLIQINYWMNYNPFLNKFFMSLSIMFLLSLLISFRKEIYDYLKSSQ